MTVAFLARRPWFAEHLAPVWLALPEEARGPFIVWGDEAAAGAAERMGVTVTKARAGTRGVYIPQLTGQPVVVAGYKDHIKAREMRASSIAMVPHGIGQSYAGRGPRHPAWVHMGSPGGTDRHDIGLFLHPGPHPAARDKERYPKARVEQVGSPILDRLPHKPRDGKAPIIAITTHWCATMPEETPETHGALLCPTMDDKCPSWATRGWFGITDAIAELARHYQVIGHGHPRNMNLAATLWESMGIEVVRSFDEVCRRADVLIGDNTSVLFEFAATGRPVVLLDPPWYDLSIPHGLRFGLPGEEVGLHVSDPRTLTDTVTQSIEGKYWPKRDEALHGVFAYRDHAAERAAVTLMDWLGERRMAA
jgi:hypothetical protein